MQLSELSAINSLRVRILSVLVCCFLFQSVIAAPQLEILPPKNQHALDLEANMANPQDKIGKVILSTPNKNFMASDIKIYEAHWQGMDTMELDDELKKKLGYPKGLEGIFVIEVTLSAARSGMLAGDIVVAVEDEKITDLKSFQNATREIQAETRAKISVMRKAKNTSTVINRNTGKVIDEKVQMNKRVFTVRDTRALGFAQVESAPMIVPGDFRPHGYKGPCTDCHAIGNGFQLAQDPDLITLPPPIISEQTALQAPPHEYKGQCHICHQINKALQ